MARTQTNQERDLRRTIAENEAAIARIYEQIDVLEDRLIEIQTHDSEVAQFPQESTHDQQYPFPSLASRAKSGESGRGGSAEI
jgi:hypothetical protein